jgi:hypothetical protein
VTEVFAFASLGFAGALVYALWRLVLAKDEKVRLRDEIVEIENQLVAVNRELVTQQIRTKGYKEISHKLREEIDAKNKMLKDAGVSPGTVINSLLSDNEDGGP